MLIASLAAGIDIGGSAAGAPLQPGEEPLGESAFLEAFIATRPPGPATSVVAHDVPGDGGRQIAISWTRSRDDGAGDDDVVGYDILRSTQPGRGYLLIDEVPPGVESYVDTTATDGTTYYYIVRAKDDMQTVDSEPSGPAASRANWFRTRRLNMFIILVLFFSFVLTYIAQARRGKELFVRRIPGLTAVEEAIGRATEMGKPVLYVPGIGEIDNIMTVASLSILTHVAKITARYESPLLVPTARAVVMSAAEEVVKEAYLSVGKPDAYNPDNIRYLSDAQFAFAAAVNGIMLRERPAANLYMGAFWAESLLLAETGFEAGAIQVAGTAMVSQLPFFITACDYTLIGEELYAASAYLSREPKLLGSLKGSDLGKAFVMVAIIVGVIMETAVAFGVAPLTAIADIFRNFFYVAGQ